MDCTYFSNNTISDLKFNSFLLQKPRKIVLLENETYFMRQGDTET